MNINEVELATNLAHNATYDEMFNDEKVNSEEELFENNEYTREAQILFDAYYSYFYNEIIKTEQKDEL